MQDSWGKILKSMELWPAEILPAGFNVWFHRFLWPAWRKPHVLSSPSVCRCLHPTCLRYWNYHAFRLSLYPRNETSVSHYFYGWPQDVICRGSVSENSLNYMVAWFVLSNQFYVWVYNEYPNLEAQSVGNPVETWVKPSVSLLPLRLLFTPLHTPLEWSKTKQMDDFQV